MSATTPPEGTPMTPQTTGYGAEYAVWVDEGDNRALLEPWMNARAAEGYSLAKSMPDGMVIMARGLQFGDPDTDAQISLERRFAEPQS